MIALRRAADSFYIQRQCVHLVGLELTAGTRRVAAGDRRQAMVELAPQRLRAVEPRRRFALQRRTGAERLDDEAERFELVRLVGERRQVARLNERLPIGAVHI